LPTSPSSAAAYVFGVRATPPLTIVVFPEKLISPRGFAVSGCQWFIA
jgi:hypothetical protein